MRAFAAAVFVVAALCAFTVQAAIDADLVTSLPGRVIEGEKNKLRIWKKNKRRRKLMLIIEHVLTFFFVNTHTHILHTLTHTSCTHTHTGWSGQLPSKHYSGYLPVANGTAFLHYWLIESEVDPANAPVGMQV